MFKRALSVVLAFCVVMSTSLPVLGATPQAQTMPEILSEVEKSLYGQAQTQNDTGLIIRLQKIEEDIFGVVQKGDIQSRINTIKALAIGGGSGASLLMKLNVTEWVVFGRLVAGSPLRIRLESIEKEFYGSTQAGAIGPRIQSLVDMVWPSGAFESAQVTAPINTPVKVKLQAPISSKTAKPGDEVDFIVSESVVVEGKVVVAAGTHAKGRITEVKPAASMGRSGDVNIDFGKVFALDGTQVTVAPAAKAGEQKSSSELAAGASLLGLVTLGPVGVLGGVLIKGQELEVQAGVEMTLTIAQQVTVQGLSLQPSK